MSDLHRSGSWPQPASQPTTGNDPGNQPPPVAPASGYVNSSPGSAPFLPAPGQEPPARRRNGFGIAALVIGIVSLVGSAIPVINYVSGVLALIGLVLGIVGICLKNRARGTAITGSILSLIAIATSIILAITYTTAFVDNLKGFSLTRNSTDAADDPGTVGNPLSLGTATTLGANEPEWVVSVNDVLLYSDDDEYQTAASGSGPSAGNRYISVELTVTYLGDSSATPSNALDVAFVAQNETEYSPSTVNPRGPNTPFDELGPVYPNDHTSASVVIEVPEEVLSTGLVRVELGAAGSCYYSVY